MSIEKLNNRVKKPSKKDVGAKHANLITVDKVLEKRAFVE